MKSSLFLIFLKLSMRSGLNLFNLRSVTDQNQDPRLRNDLYSTYFFNLDFQGHFPFRIDFLTTSRLSLVEHPVSCGTKLTT
jgi:hypothetical protein